MNQQLLCVQLCCPWFSSTRGTEHRDVCAPNTESCQICAVEENTEQPPRLTNLNVRSIKCSETSIDSTFLLGAEDMDTRLQHERRSIVSLSAQKRTLFIKSFPSTGTTTLKLGLQAAPSIRDVAIVPQRREKPKPRRDNGTPSPICRQRA